MSTVNKIVTLAILTASTLCSLQAFAISDSDITSEVKNKIQSNATTTNSQIDVSTKKGIVNLSGNVQTEGEASSAIETANSITGVKDVDTDHLMVNNGSQPYKDAYITSKVKGTFLREKIFGDKPVDAMSINVETKDGVVYLTGTAQNKAQENTAIKIAKTIKGVKDVNSTVVVGQ